MKLRKRALPDFQCFAFYQVIIYNHGLLSLTTDDAVVVVADLDEYLVTPQPVNMHQVKGATDKRLSYGAFQAPLLSPSLADHV